MANVSPDLLSDDLYRKMLLNQLWQNQLTNGANIANMGGQTALGLAIGSGLGNWLGYKFGNWQQARDDNRRYKNPAAQAAIQNLFGEADLSWQPPPNPYPFPTTQAERLAGIGAFNPNWRQETLNKIQPVDWQMNPTLTPQIATKPFQGW